MNNISIFAVYPSLLILSVAKLKVMELDDQASVMSAPFAARFDLTILVQEINEQRWGVVGGLTVREKP